MHELKTLKTLFVNKPQFIVDLVHVQHFKTGENEYYQYGIMHIFHSLPNKTEWIDINLILASNVLSYEIINDKYIFKEDLDEMGFPKSVSFYRLFCLILKHTQSCISPNDMIDKLYSSKEPLLIKLAEDSINRHTAIQELFDIVSSEECNTGKKWTLVELLSRDWNFKLLSLNPSVWHSLFVNTPSQSHLTILNSKIKSIEREPYTLKGYKQYVSDVDKIIIETFQRIANLRKSVWEKIKRDLYTPSVMEELILLDEKEHFIVGVMEGVNTLVGYIHFEYLISVNEKTNTYIIDKITEYAEKLRNIAIIKKWTSWRELIITPYRLSSYKGLQYKNLPIKARSFVFMNEYPNYDEKNFKLGNDNEIMKFQQAEYFLENLMKAGENIMKTTPWVCKLCDGDEETGCLMSDVQDCPYGRGI